MPDDTAPVYSRRYLAWALGLLFATYACSFADRSILSVLQQPIKEELLLSDAQLGLLGGFAFAALYSTLGIPIARLAERGGRRTIISFSLLLWSAMTALCGTAQSYGALFALRMGVGVGEAGGNPPAQSLIADYFPPERRATALSIYSLGISAGIVAGSVLGGAIAQRYGWRAAFYVAGLPGIALALLVRLTLREPPHGASDKAHATATTPPAITAVLRLAARRPALLNIAVGAALTSFAGYGINAFSAPYLIRAFHVGLTTAGLYLGLIAGVTAAIGTLAGGLVTDRLAPRDTRWYVRVPAIGLAAAAPLYAAGYMMPTAPLSLAVLVVPPLFHYAYLGPTFGLLHNMVGARMRATATALLYFVINFVGLGFGPTVVGAASDWYARRAFAGDFAASCPGGVGASPGLAEACGLASAHGVRLAIVSCTAVYLWAAVHYALAARTLRRDLDRSNAFEA